MHSDLVGRRTADLHEGLGAPVERSRPDRVGNGFLFKNTGSEQDGPALARWYPLKAAKLLPISGPQVVWVAILLILMLSWAGQALAAGRVQEFLPKVQPGEFFAGADRYRAGSGRSAAHPRLPGRPAPRVRLSQRGFHQRHRLFRQADPHAGGDRPPGHRPRHQARRPQGAHRPGRHPGAPHRRCR